MLSIGSRERVFALQVARDTLKEHLASGTVPPHHTSEPSLLQIRCAFVTLRNLHTGALRGCRGECRPVRPLIESILRQTISSATEDTRFDPVTRAEVDDLSIRISALTPLWPITPREIVVGRHGLLIVRGTASGLLLPEVPRHFGLTTAAEFLSALCRKAQLSPPQFDPATDQLSAFETESWGDQDA